MSNTPKWSVPTATATNASDTIDWASPAPEPNSDLNPINPKTEQDAYAELLKLFADNPEDDCEVTTLSLDEFATNTFTPATETQE